MKISTVLLFMAAIGLAVDAVSVLLFNGTAAFTTENSIYITGSMICRTIEALKK